jgi:hypothetical protein
MVKSATTENPSVVKLDQQIASVKSTVVESLCDYNPQNIQKRFKQE